MDKQIHESRFIEYGNIRFEKEENGILLQKRYSSVVYCPAADERAPGAMYPRCICLEHSGENSGTLLATFECYSHETPVFPIYESRDDGRSWKRIGQVEDREKGHGCRYQPFLFEVPAGCRGLDEGTLLLAGNIIPEGGGTTALHLYKSTDGGRNWTFVSEIVSGGTAYVDVAGIEDCDRPVWEPFLMMTKDGRLVCYYSDERYNRSRRYNQLLGHLVSEDGGKTWGELKIDVAMGDGVLRPGMPVIADADGKKYMMVYEIINEDRVPVYFRLSDDMEDWGDPEFIGNLIQAEDGSMMTGTPYVTWIPQGGPEGTYLASGRGFSHIMTNSSGGRGYWKKMPVLIEVDNSTGSAGYSQCIVKLHGGRQILSLCPRQISPELSMIEAAVADVYVRA